MRQMIRAAALLCVLAATASAQTQVLCNQGSSKLPCTAPLLQGYISATTTAVELGYVHGVTSPLQTQLAALQPLSSNLTAFLALNTTGIVARTGTNTWALRAIAAGAGVTVTNGDGVAGAPTIALTNTSLTLASGTGLSVAGCSPVSLGGTCTISLGTELAGVAGLSTTGLVTRTAAGIYTTRAVTAGTGIGVTNGDGVAGAPTVAIDATVATLTGSQILTNKTLSCVNNTCTVRLGSDVTGFLPIANGGTNSTTALTGNQVMVSSGGKIVELGAATNGQILIGSTGVLPVLATPTGANGLTVTGGVGSLAFSQTFGTDSSHATVGNDTRLPPAPSGAGKILYDNASAYVEASAGTTSQVLVGGAAPAFGNVPAAALTSVPAASLTGTVPIGTIPTGSSGSTVTIGNDARLPPAPTAANKLLYDTGSAIAETAACSTATTMLVGGSPPACSASGSLGTQLTTPLVTSAAGLTMNAATGQAVMLAVNSSNVVSVSSTGETFTQPLAMSSQKITGGATATNAGDFLVYPWITATQTCASLSAASHSITSPNGTFENIGLTATLPGAGTFVVTASVRSNVQTSVGVGFLVAKFRNTTDSTDIANSERIAASGGVVNVGVQNTTIIQEVITVAASKVIDVQMDSNSGTTYSDRTAYSDTSGRSRICYLQIAP